MSDPDKTTTKLDPDGIDRERIEDLELVVATLTPPIFRSWTSAVARAWTRIKARANAVRSVRGDG